MGEENGSVVGVYGLKIGSFEWKSISKLIKKLLKNTEILLVNFKKIKEKKKCKKY